MTESIQGQERRKASHLAPRSNSERKEEKGKKEQKTWNTNKIRSSGETNVHVVPGSQALWRAVPNARRY